MYNFKEFITEMTANTILSDINEIQTGYFLNGKKWFSDDARKACEERMKQAKPDEVTDAIGKAEVMAKEFIAWAKSNGYSGVVKQVWWTARPGELARASGNPDADSRKNPTDILVKFSSGPADGFLGLSAKATKTSGEIGFKNPGVGTIDKALNTGIAAEYKNQEAQMIKKYDLPQGADARKKFIRSDPDLKQETEQVGVKCLAAMRDVLYARLLKLENTELLQYLLQYWMDADVLIPPYVKVTGMGNKPPYKAAVMDPLKNPKLDAIF